MLLRCVAEFLVGPRRIGPIVVSGVYVAEDSDAAFIPLVNLRQVRSEGIGVQQADGYCELALRSDAVDIGGAVSECRQLRILLRHGLDQRKLFVRVFASFFISLR